MKYLLAATLAACLVVTGLVAGLAQNEEMTSVATGLDVPAGWADDNGAPVANIAVTSVDIGGSDDSILAEPTDDDVLVAVDFTISNTYMTPIVMKPAGFTLVDATGVPHGNVRLDTKDDVFADEMNLSAGASVDLTLAYTVPDGVVPAVFLWNPGNGLQVIVDIFHQPGESTVFAHGTRTPVTNADADGNAISTLEVIGVNASWLDTDGYDGSGYEMRLLEVRYRFTNQSGARQVIRGSDFSPVDTLGTMISSSGEHASADDELALDDEIEIAAGETTEFTRIHGLANDRTLAYIMWSPSQAAPGSHPFAFVVLTEDDMVPATPVVTPIG